MEEITDFLERWPGYTEQSWQQRFIELDRQMEEMSSARDQYVRVYMDRVNQLNEANSRRRDMSEDLRRAADLMNRAVRYVLATAPDDIARAVVVNSMADFVRNTPTIPTSEEG